MILDSYLVHILKLETIVENKVKIEKFLTDISGGKQVSSVYFLQDIMSLDRFKPQAVHRLSFFYITIIVEFSVP